MDINVNSINKSFKGQLVLDNISMSFLEGSVTCIMGASGVGKTTLAYILMGLSNADSGEIIGLSGKKVSVVFQEDRLIEHWDAVKNIMLVCHKGVTKEKVERHLSDIGLTEYESKPVRALSGGMRRRVAIVRALLCECDVLIMDEPFKELDEKLKKKAINYVKENTKEKTLIIITHDRNEVHMLDAKLITMRAVD